MRSIWIIFTLFMLTSSFASAAASPSVSLVHSLQAQSVPGAVVVAESTDGYGSATASSDGSFVISEGLPDGTYSIEVFSIGYLSALLENIAVSNGNVTDIGDLFLNASAVLKGAVIGPAGEPVANTPVTLVSLETNLTVAETLSDASGAFTFNTDIRNGTYNISAIPFRHPYTFSPGYTGNTTGGILAVEGLTSSGIIVQMGLSCSVSGTVTESPSGDPLEGISIVAVNAGTIVGYAKTGQDGKYNISSNLPEGTYNVTVTSPVGFIYRTSTGMRTLDLTLQQGATVDYSLSRSATLSGYVTYSNGMPAPQIPVFCFSTDYSYAGSAYTNGSGYYQINSGLGTGTYGVVANNDVSKRNDINLVQNHESSMNFTLATSGATKGYAAGVVSSASGSPMAGANVSHSSGWATSDGNGSYVVEVTLPEGQSNATLGLTCSAKGYIAASVDVTVYAGLCSRADFSLQRSPSGTIAGRVLSAGASPIKENASLTLEVSPATVNLGASLDISGALSVPVAGTITVWWSINGSGFEDSMTCPMVGGAYSCPLIPSATGEYSFKAEWAGDASYNPAESLEAHASVLAPATKQNSSLSIVAAPSNVAVGSNATISGSISPAVAATVSIYVSINGSAMAHLQDVDAADGAFSIQVNLTQVGTYAFKASWLGNDDYEGAESGTAAVSSVQVQQKVTPEVVIGSSKYAVTIASGGSATVTINGTVLPFEQTAVLLWVSDPQNSSTAITINATSYSFGTTLSLDKAGTWVLHAEVPEGDYYARTMSDNITISVTVQQAAGDSTTLIVIAAAVAVGAVLLFAYMRRRR